MKKFVIFLIILVVYVLDILRAVTDLLPWPLGNR